MLVVMAHANYSNKLNTLNFVSSGDMYIRAQMNKPDVAHPVPPMPTDALCLCRRACRNIVNVGGNPSADRDYKDNEPLNGSKNRRLGPF